MTSALSQLMDVQVEDLDLDDLDLEVTPPVPVSELVRELVLLDESDLTALRAAGPEHSTPSLKSIRAYHHVIALRLALGDRASAIAASLGFTPSTISVLQKDPQFISLVETYRDEMVTKAVDHAELLSLVSFEALSALHDRLIGDGRDEIPLEALRRIAETTVDRAGFSPIRRSETLNHHVHSLSREAIERVKDLHQEDASYNTPVDVGGSSVAAPQEAQKSLPTSSSGENSLVPARPAKAQLLTAPGPDLREQGSEDSQG